MNLSSPCPSAGATACTLSSSRPEPTRHSLGKVSPYPQCKPAPLSDPQCPPHILLTGPCGPLQHSSLFTHKLSTEDKGSLFILCTVLPCPNSVAEFVNTSTNHQKPEDPLVSLVGELCLVPRGQSQPIIDETSKRKPSHRDPSALTVSCLLPGVGPQRAGSYCASSTLDSFAQFKVEIKHATRVRLWWGFCSGEREQNTG